MREHRNELPGHTATATFQKFGVKTKLYRGASLEKRPAESAIYTQQAVYAKRTALRYMERGEGVTSAEQTTFAVKRSNWLSALAMTSLPGDRAVWNILRAQTTVSTWRSLSKDTVVWLLTVHTGKP